VSYEVDTFVVVKNGLFSVFLLHHWNSRYFSPHFMVRWLQEGITWWKITAICDWHAGSGSQSGEILGKAVGQSDNVKQRPDLFSLQLSPGYRAQVTCNICMPFTREWPESNQTVAMAPHWARPQAELKKKSRYRFVYKHKRILTA
jgi:hypothetical protein